MRPLVKPLVAVVALSLATSSAFAAMGAGKTAGKTASCGPVVNKDLDRVINPNSVTRELESCWADRFAFGGNAKFVAQRAEGMAAADTTDTFFNVRSLQLLTDIAVSKDINLHVTASASSTLDDNMPVSATELNNFGIQEAYMTIENLAKSPVFLKAGKSYTSFGRYEETVPAVYSLNQSLVQADNTHVALGFASKAGFDLSAFVYEDETNDNWDQYGFSANFARSMKGADLAFSVSYIDNYSTLNGTSGEDTTNTNADEDVSAYDIALSAKMRDFKIGVEYFAADDVLVNGQTASTAKPKLVSFGAQYDFLAGGKKGDVHFGYEKASDASAMTSALNADWSAFPEKHTTIGVGVDLGKGAELSLDYHKFEPFAANASSQPNDQTQLVAEVSLDF